MGLDLAVHRADHQKGAGDFLEDLLGEKLQVHLPGCLMEKKESTEFNATFTSAQSLNFSCSSDFTCKSAHFLTMTIFRAFCFTNKSRFPPPVSPNSVILCFDL